MAGETSSRFDLTLERVLHGGPPHYTTDFLSADAVPRHERRFTEFSGDVSGRALEALSAVAELTGKPIAQLDSLVSATLGLQRADGHFGEEFSTTTIANRDMALLWGNGRMLVGLMTNYHLSQNPQVLAAARRLGDCFVTMAPRLNTDAVQKEFSDTRIAVGYICWTQVMEGLVELARVTGDSRYTQLSRQIAARTRRYPSQHSHGFATTLRALVELSRLTGDKALLVQAEREWQGIVDSGNLLDHGALPEAFKPMIDRDEGCSEADWLRLNLALWSATGNTRYLEHAQHCLFNEFSLNQFSSGDFGHHTLSPVGVKPPAARAWWCCTFHGLRAFPDVFHAAFSEKDGALVYDLPVDGTAKAGGLAVRAESHLGGEASVVLEIAETDAAEHTLAVRVPKWARKVHFELDGKPLEAAAEGGLASVRRAWSKGQKLTLRYELITRAERQADGHVVLFRGPWILGVDDSLSPRFFDEPWVLNRLILPAISESGEIVLDPAPKSEAADSTARFAAGAARAGVRYLPGGYAMQPQTALLRPIAEQTGSDDRTTWQWRFSAK